MHTNKIKAKVDFKFCIGRYSCNAESDKTRTFGAAVQGAVQ